jgi:hypothetical protein
LEYLPEEANYVAQRYARYRMIIFSNFFTLEDAVHAFESPLRALLSDLRTGSVVIVVGARGNHYQGIYGDLTRVAKECGMFGLSDVQEVLGRDSYSVAAPVIKQAQYRVYEHLEKIVGKDQLGHSREYPDYWSPEPNPRKRVDFALHVFRKGEWPRRIG